MDRSALILYGITDRNCIKHGKSLSQAVTEAIDGGMTMLQLREKELKGEELTALAKEIQSICKARNIPFIINDDVELAHKINADGVHVGQDDMAAAEARKILGPDKIIGVTAKTPEQAELAYKAGADYIGSGALFGSTTKKDAVNMTLETFAQITASSQIPVVAIGGIKLDNAETLTGSGAAGLAVISAIFGAEDITGDTKKLKKMAEQL